MFQLECVIAKGGVNSCKRVFSRFGITPSDIDAFVMSVMMDASEIMLSDGHHHSFPSTSRI